MKKVKLLSIIAICLFSINIFWIWFFISHQPPHGRKQDPKKVIIEKLHFNEQQKKEYEKLIAVHKGNIRKQEQQILMLKNLMYLKLNQNPNNRFTDSLIARIGRAQMEIEHINYNHVQDISRLCKLEQKNSFYELCFEIAKLFTPPSAPHNEKH